MEKEEKEMNLYEVSFHLVSSLSSDEALAAHEKISALIGKAGGNIKTSQLPQERVLTYEMIKEAGGKKTYYTTSLFGFIIFEAPKEAAEEIGGKIKKEKHVLRHLLISLPKVALMPRERRIPTTHREEIKRVPETAPTKVDEATIDKTIEELVIE